jgi:hypothetical protein
MRIFAAMLEPVNDGIAKWKPTRNACERVVVLETFSSVLLKWKRLHCFIVMGDSASGTLPDRSSLVGFSTAMFSEPPKSTGSAG